MASLHIEEEFFQCSMREDLAIMRIDRGAKRFYTSVSTKDSIRGALDTIKNTEGVKGLAVVYSDEYPGNSEYRQLLSDIYQKGTHSAEGTLTTFKSALKQSLEMINDFPMPIVGGLNGEIDPDAFGISLAFDLRIVSESAVFYNHNLELGFPPSAILSYFLSQSLGSHKALELMINRTAIKPNEALELGLINQVVPSEDLEIACLDKLCELTSLPAHAIVEARKLMKPNTDALMKHIDACFEAGLRCMYKMRK